MSRVSQRVEEWKRKIVDLSRRNRSLYFSRTHASTLKIIQPTLTEIFDRLTNAEKPWQFFMPPDEKRTDEEPSDSDNSQALTLEGLSGVQTGQAEDDAPVKRGAGEVVTDVKDGARLRAILRNLYRRSRTDFEERGVRILFLTFGMLEWKEIEQSETVKSPILLVPAELKRDSVNDPFELRPVDEEIVINPALAVKLSDDFNIALPTIPEDWEAVPLAQFLKGFRDQVARYEWTVSDECWLGLFSFHKLVIYHDLKSHAGALEAHTIVRCLCEEEAQSSGPEPPDPTELDKKTSPDTSFLVADADSSQLVCIEAVKAGDNMVIQGPPGTGKSQTITNLVSEFIARGKSVLFVSEKMAALEVVFDRLKKAGLGYYCLQLHSQRANKREVIQELYKTHSEQLKPQKGLTELEIKQLIERRKKLNDYVHSLHLVRRPLGSSAFEVLGFVAQLNETAYIPTGAFDASVLTPELFDSAEQLSKRLQPLWHVATAGREFPWFGCTVKAFSLATKAELETRVAECSTSISALQKSSGNLAGLLGFDAPQKLSIAEWLLKTSQMLAVCPGIERNWVLGTELSEFTNETERYLRLSKIHAENRATLNSSYTPAFLSLPSDLGDRLNHALRQLTTIVGRPLENDSGLVVNRGLCLQWAHELSKLAETWPKDGTILQHSLGLSESNLNLPRLRQLVRIAELCESEERPDEQWFELSKLRDLAQSLPSLREAFESRNRERRLLFADYEPEILELDIKNLIEKFSGPYSSFLRIFRPSYFKAKRIIRRLRKGGKLPASILADLRRVQALKDREERLHKDFPKYKEQLGAHFRGFETDFDRASRSLANAQELVRLVSLQPLPPQLIRQASAQGLATIELRTTAPRLKQSIADWEKTLPEVRSVLPSNFSNGPEIPTTEKPLDELKLWAENLTNTVNEFSVLIDTVLPCARSTDGITCQQIITDLDRLVELGKIEAQVDSESQRLKKHFGHRFNGIETAWVDVLAALHWTAEFLAHLGDRQIPESLLGIMIAGKDKAPGYEALGTDLNRVRAALQALGRHFADGFPAVSGASFWDADFVPVLSRLSEMAQQLDSLRDWIDYRQLHLAFQDFGLGEFFDTLITKFLSLPSGHLPSALKKSFLQAWLNFQFADDPCLGAFRGENHERLITEFRELDKKHWQEGVHSVIREINRLRPASSVVIPGGELGILLKEANKQRRHLPLRKLFGLIPNLLTQLKPCLLMSPISVSQFLDPEKMKFDVVIFDEASQLRSEDAICSVYRGKQLVVCGDNKQLPPTTFFEQGMSEDLSDESDDPNALEAFDVFDSVLDACAAVMPQRQLKWHYRSEHESLIAFSNCIFYDFTLITFPSWLQEDEAFGVKFVFVPDGVYDRGGKRDNVREAEKVVGLVEEHLRRYPEQSLGVVTFNISQADTIENHLEQFRHQNAELERYFSPDKAEKFFVKNLESVQGDERDVLIFSVGYGKDKFGRMTMNFGPLNGNGGERRLNVAVTRARKKVIVVSSIRAADFDLNQVNKEGVRVLQRYLDFAERGTEALELRVGEGEYESPFEQSVAAAIRGLGYTVIPQVGCSSFRVDLGVVDPANPGRFILGIECDGASYHSSATARDRDRIRQQILERLGWRIHRIWSPDWVTRNNREVDRLRQAIETAIKNPKVPDCPPPSPLSSEPRSTNGPTVVEKDISEADEKFVLPEWVQTYSVCKLRVPQTRLQFHDPAAQPLLKRMLSQIVEVEGPIHKDLAATRLAQSWELERVGERMMNAVKLAWRSLSREKLLRIQTTFLWPADEGFQVKVRRPDPGDDHSRRSIEEIPAEEIALALKNLTRDSLSIEHDKLLLLVARIFGFERAGNHIHKSLANTFEGLLESRQIVLIEGRVSLPN